MDINHIENITVDVYTFEGLKNTIKKNEQYFKALATCMDKFKTSKYIDIFTHPEDVMKVVTLTSKRKTIDGYFKALKCLLNKLPIDIQNTIDKKSIDYLNNYKQYLPIHIEDEPKTPTPLSDAPDDKLMFCEDNDEDSLKYVHARLDIIEKRLADLTDNNKDSLKQLDIKLNGECIATNDMLKFALKQQRKINLRQHKIVKLLLGTLHPQMADVVDIFTT